MKLVIIEPLGVEEEKLMEIAHKALPDSVEIVSYQTKVTDTESLIERGKDADIIMVANLPLNAEVIKGCKNLKMLAVAYTLCRKAHCAALLQLPAILYYAKM